MSSDASEPLRVLFVCWGYSIHARRRVQIFIDDRRFAVTVVSTYDYAFKGATNVLLSAARRDAQAPPKRRALGTLPMWLRTLLKKTLQLALIGSELRTAARDFAILRDTVAEFAPHVIFLQTLQYPCFLAYRLPKAIPMLVTFWNGDLTHFAKWTGLEMLAKKWLVKYGLRRVDALTVNSQTAYDAALGLGADRRKITLIRYPGADLALFHPRDKAESRARLQINAAHVVLCPRGLGAFFNSDTIVRAAAEVAQSYPDVLFLFVSGVGGEEEWARHVALARELGIEDRIRWDGQVPWEQMPWYYGSADAMVSIMTSDSCPNCMLEAMACGVPVVMSDTRQNREWIDEGRNGLLCEPRDARALSRAIRVVFENRALAEQFARISLAKVQAGANSALNIERIRALVAALATRAPPASTVDNYASRDTTAPD